MNHEVMYWTSYIPMMYGVGASRSCSAPIIDVGKIGITGNMY